MSLNELMMEGVILMVLGMGIVFFFLVVLVFALFGMSRVASMIEARHGAGAAPTAEMPSVPVAADAGGELIAVIGAAVARYRASRR